MLGIGTRQRAQLTRRRHRPPRPRRRSSGACAALEGAPAIVVANAGEVNAGDFDPIAADGRPRGARTASWLHVDGAFGLFARATPRTAHLAAGVERASSVSSDGHKWLNVPYDCGFAFVRDASPARTTFAIGAPLSPDAGRAASELRRPAGPRARAAPGRSRSGRRCAPTAATATARWSSATWSSPGISPTRVDAAPELERLAEVPLNIVCFRCRPASAPTKRARRAQRPPRRSPARGRARVRRHHRFEGKVAFRPAIVNWRTRAEDVDLLVDSSSSSSRAARIAGMRPPADPRLRAPLRASGTPRLARSFPPLKLIRQATSPGPTGPRRFP